MSKVKDLTGLRFGRLTVVCRAGSNERGRAMWECLCACGNYVTVVGKLLLNGDTKSCGCLIRRNAECLNLKHGQARAGKVERLYKVWLSMKTRVHNPNSNVYKHYGGRGITICKEWDESYAAFSEWAMSHGYDAGAKRGMCTLDRIDVNGGYSPENCRFVDQRTQMKNTRKSVKA